MPIDQVGVQDRHVYLWQMPVPRDGLRYCIGVVAGIECADRGTRRGVAKSRITMTDHRRGLVYSSDRKVMGHMISANPLHVP